MTITIHDWHILIIITIVCWFSGKIMLDKLGDYVFPIVPMFLFAMPVILWIGWIIGKLF